MMEAIHFSELLSLQEPHGLTSQKTTFFIVTADETSNVISNKDANKLMK
jgi:hypothetical protein